MAVYLLGCISAVFLDIEICSDLWNNYNAQVVCRQLGFTDGVLIDNVINRYPSSSGDIFLSNITCDGSESAIVDCKHNDWSDNDCSHTKDVNVFCKVPSYRGCVVSEYPDYALTGKQVGLSGPLRLDTCMENCENFEFMGLEGGDSCFCGSDNYKEYGEVEATACTTPCEGDSSQYCGGSSRMAVYQRRCLPAGSSSGVVISPNFPGDYGSNQQCQIQIDLSMNANTYVTFHLFELTGDDMLTLSDERGDTVTYSASNPPQLRTTIDSQTLYVNFVSSATSLGGPGYVITYNGLLKCPPDIQFANGTLLMEDHEFYYEGDTAIVMCDDGFEPIEEELVCTEEGVWSATPSCIKVSRGELPDEEQDESNFEPILFMCVIIVAVLGLAFLIVIIGILCTSKQNKAGDKMPLENTDTSSSEKSESVNQDMFDSGQGHSNPQVEIEDANAADSDEEESRYLSNLY
ncbi:deleted in malignant brain tumors 1 protein-like [Anneissia japonica]|uniref:deleted in malignant brain tumors 1 protein-like n=1 Tax=Anneissia japonica TaxID=1529436 RepID=UPI0014255DBB|nr:deleted in malignant brain tumors 1 protein-like [Anneissia japonica]